MEVNSSTLLNILLPNNNSVLKEALKEADLKQLHSKGFEKSLQSIVNNLFSELISGTKSNETIMNLLKNSNIGKELLAFPKQLQLLLNLLKGSTTLEGYSSKLQSFLVDIKDMTQSNLKSQIESSGLFLEAKLGTFAKNALNGSELFNLKDTKLFKDEFSSDIKAVLLQLQKELGKSSLNTSTQEMLKHIDKLLVQIEYSQLVSLTTQSNTIYLPFLWDLLEEGSIATGKSKDELFYCQINLTLKEHGKLDLLVALDKNEIDITMHTENKEFKKRLQSYLFELKKGLSSVGLTPKSISVYQSKDSEFVDEKKGSNFLKQYKNELSFGLDLRV